MSNNRRGRVAANATAFALANFSVRVRVPGLPSSVRVSAANLCRLGRIARFGETPGEALARAWRTHCAARSGA